MMTMEAQGGLSLKTKLGTPRGVWKVQVFRKTVSLISSPNFSLSQHYNISCNFRFSLTKCVCVELKEKWRRQFEKSAVRLTSAKPGNCLYQKTLTKLHHLQLVNCGELQLTTLRISDDVNNCLQNHSYLSLKISVGSLSLFFSFREFHKFEQKTRHSVKMLLSVHQSMSTRMRPNQGNNGSFNKVFLIK